MYGMGGGYNQTLKASSSVLTIDGKKWGVPYSYYHWGVYYREDIFRKLGIKIPKTWDEFLNACKTLKSNGITPLTIGTKFLWPVAGVFDYLDLRVNGYEFHNKLTAGKIKYTDPRVQKVFDRFDELVKPGYFIKNHLSYSWQEALAPMVQGKAAMVVMGNFAVPVFQKSGLNLKDLGFFQFPEITKDLPRAEEAPIDSFHIPKNAKNKKDAKTFLAFLAQADIQSKINAILIQLPVNNKAKIADDKFLKAGFKMLNSAYGLTQFYDRDAPAQMAKAGMEGFQQYMVYPNRRDKILKRLDKIQKQVYKSK